MDEGKYGRLLRSIGVSVFPLFMPRGSVSLSGLLRLWRILRQERPNLVQTWMYHADVVGGSVARVAGIRSVCWGLHNSNLSAGKTRKSTILVARLWAVLSRWVPKRIVSCSQRAVIVHTELGFDAERCVVIPNGYDVSVFQRSPEDGQQLRKALGLPAGLPVIGCVARFDPQKDHANLIGALALLRNEGCEFSAVLVGTGVLWDTPSLAALVEDAGLADVVYLLGRRDDMPAVMSALDIHVLSSSFGEAFPNVLAEAMACGVPCVTTDVGDAALIVDDTGWAVPPGDPEALADAIIAALREWKETSGWPKRQAAARERIQTQFSVERMARAYEDVWRAVACVE